jgi:outer membrane receptor protein involved in Fe transport
MRLFRSATSALAVAAVLSLPAMVRAETGVDAAAAPTDAPADDGNMIIVTGTRIARPELQSAMPISVIHMDDAKNFGRETVYDALLLNPAIGPGLGDSNSQGQEYDTGVANINLRNMGNNRSLVVVDGQRWVSGGARTSAVDLNTIPSAMIDRFEVVTGGAAAIYGADAVTGAVNIIMKKNITGFHISATNGISEKGDGRQSDLSASTGFNFDGGRGHFVIGGEYTDTAPVRWSDRYSQRHSFYANPANTGLHDGIPDNVLAQNYGSLYRSANPSFYNAKTAQWYQLQNGAVVPVGFNTVVTAGETGTGDGGPVVTGLENHFLRDQSEKHSVYSHVSYELTPAITWNATFNYAHSFTAAAPEWPEVRTDARTTNWWGGTTGEVATLTNPYLPDSIRQYMIANKLTSLPIYRSYFNLPEAFEYHHRDNITVGTDVGGKLTGNLTWTAFVRYGQVIDHINTTNMVGKSEWLYARNAITDPVTGQIECADATARANGCQPLNFFSTAPYSQALLNYIEFSRQERTKNSLLNGGGSLNGKVFSLPYGDVSIAAGLEWRRETLRTRDDPNTAKLSDIVFAPGEDYALHPALDAARDTTELYGEMVVPLLADLPLVKRLEIEGAYRFSHYSDNPDTNTWKAGATWQPFSGLTLRGVYSHSIRVPNFGELFSPISNVTYGHISDPCQSTYVIQNANRLANCQALLPGVTVPLPSPNLNAPIVYSGGNPALTPETSNSYTLGAVFQPKFLRGFDITVDYWNIKIDNVITSLAYTTLLNSCVDSAGGPNQAYCQFIHRNADGSVASVQAQYANLAGQKARGIDFGANYRTALGKGLARLSFNGTYLLQQTTIAQIGTAGIDYAGQWNYPRFKGTLMTDYSIGKFTLGINTRYISRSLYSATAASDETYGAYSHVPAYVYNDLTVQYRPTGKYSLTLGVKNVSNVGIYAPLQDSAPGPHLSNGGNSTGAAYYDPIGRYFFAKVDVNF